MTTKVSENHPNFQEVQHLNTAMKKARKQLVDLYKRRDVLLGWRATEDGPKLKKPLPVFGAAPASTSPPEGDTTPRRRSGDLPVTAGTSMANQLLALLAAAPGVDWSTQELTKKLGLTNKFKNTVRDTLDGLVKAGKAKTHGRGRWIIATATAADILDARA